MDWDEALDDVVGDFARTEDKLERFIAKHGPVLSSKNRKQLEFCITTASNYKFTASGMDSNDLKTAKEMAETFLEALRDIENQFANELRS
jgi:hypothetical protein